MPTRERPAEPRKAIDDKICRALKGAAARASIIMLGDNIGHYKILEKIGEGGMGVVYRARDMRLERDVALKFLSLDFTGSEELKERFIKEAKAASVLDHPNICTIHAIEEAEDGRLFIAMAYYQGETVKAKLQRGPLAWAEIVDLAVQIAAGLKAAHGHGIIHMDVKPANLMVTPDATVKILDFGLSRFTSEIDRTRPKSPLMGTVAYMAPERVQEEATGPESDIWALGVVLYEMATGVRPFQGKNDMAVLYSIVHRDCPSPIDRVPELPVDLDRVIRKALVKDRRYRYQDIAELLAEIEPLHQSTHGTDTIPWVSRQDWQRQKWMQRLTASVAVLAVVLLTGFFWQMFWRDARGSPPPQEQAVRIAVDFAHRPSQEEPEWIGRALRELLELELEASGAVLQIVGKARAEIEPEWVLEGLFEILEPENVTRLQVEVAVARTGSETPKLLSAEGTPEVVIAELAQALAPILGISLPAMSGQTGVPGTPEAARLLSEARENLRLGNAVAALVRLEQAAGLEPGNALICIHLADAFWRLGREDEARAASTEAVSAAARLSLRTRQLVHAINLEMHYETERSTDLLHVLWAEIDAEANGGEPFGRFDIGLRLASLLAANGHSDRAKEILAPLSAAHSEHPAVMLIQGMAARDESAQEEQSLFAQTVDLARLWDASLLTARALLLEGQSWLRQKNADEAVERLEEALQIYSAERHQKGRADTIVVLGNVCRYQQDLLCAKTRYEDATRLFSSIGSHRGLAAALSNQGRILLDGGDLSAALQILKEARDLFEEEVNDPIARIVTLINLGEGEILTGQFDAAQATLDEALRSLETEQDASKRAIAMSLRGHLLLLRGDLSGAGQMLAQALRIQQQIGEEPNSAATYYYQVDLFRLEGNLEEAARSAEKSVLFFKQSELHYARALNALGEIRISQLRKNEAYSALEEALEIQNRSTNTLWPAQTRLSMARLLIEDGRIEEAEVRTREALRELSASPASLHVAAAKTMLARCLLLRGDVDSAQQAIDETRRLIQPLGAPVYDLRIDLVAARVTAARGDLRASLGELQGLLAAAKSGRFNELELEILLVLGEIELQEGRQAGRARLRELEIEARLKGFERIAEAARAAASPP